jgi:PIN domain nuclease of toxin-antitoxin system
MSQITVHVAKTNLSQLVARVEAGEEVILVRGKQPVADQGFKPLPARLLHSQAAGSLPGPQRDPFECMLISQAMLDNLVLVSNGALFAVYGVARLW